METTTSMLTTTTLRHRHLRRKCDQGCRRRRDPPTRVVLVFLCLVLFLGACGRESATKSTGMVHAWVLQQPSALTTKRRNQVQRRSRFTRDRLYYSQDEDNDEDETQRKKKRMEVVRSLQTAFYKDAVDPRRPEENVEETKVSEEPQDKTATNTIPINKLSQFNYATGQVLNVPMWRVSWMEVPGRTNVLNVHEPMYTNLFETILHSEPPWYVGHLYAPKKEAQQDNNAAAKKNVNNKERNENPWLPLQSWEQRVELIQICTKEETATVTTIPAVKDCSSVIGTLLRIVDYRRMDDGRLLLLVQALERFVVTHVLQELPYAKAHIQLLPDVEEIDDDGNCDAATATASIENNNYDGSTIFTSSSSSGLGCSWVSTRTEQEIASARALAISESFLKWHRYEYENTMLPLPLQSDLQATQVIGSALAKVLPYAPYSSVVKAAHIAKEPLQTNLQAEERKSLAASSFKIVEEKEEKQQSNVTAAAAADGTTPSPTLEYRLQQAGVLIGGSSSGRSNIGIESLILDPLRLELSSDEIEIRLWLALNDFLKQTRTPVSPILFGLIPHRRGKSSNSDSMNERDSKLVQKVLEDDSTNTNDGDDGGEDNDTWPDDFVLEKIANAIEDQTALDHKYVRVPPQVDPITGTLGYPSIRRQKRLSYSAAALLEQVDTVTPFRLRLLQFTSVKARMAYVLQCLEERMASFQ